MSFLLDLFFLYYKSKSPSSAVVQKLASVADFSATAVKYGGKCNIASARVLPGYHPYQFIKHFHLQISSFQWVNHH
jgi:hypothetical protein